MSAQPIVVDLGQCEPDHAAIKRLVESLGASVVRAHSADQAKGFIAKGGVKLVLVNRVLDSDGSDGVGLIPDLLASGKASAIKVMLVSNYQDAQAKAVGLGAEPGFGKADLRSASTLEMLRVVLELVSKEAS
jgi:hypothetical protein